MLFSLTSFEPFRHIATLFIFKDIYFTYTQLGGGRREEVGRRLGVRLSSFFSDFLFLFKGMRPLGYVKQFYKKSKKQQQQQQARVAYLVPRGRDRIAFWRRNINCGYSKRRRVVNCGGGGGGMNLLLLEHPIVHKGQQ